MSVLSAQSIRKLCPPALVSPFHERTVHEPSGTTFGLGPCTYDVRLKQGMILWPLWGRLASTIERFQIPANVCASVKDKSSVARVFVTTQNTHLDPGWEGWLTLELTNHRLWPVRLRAGQPIAQIKFEWLDEPTELPYRGKYQHQADQPVEAIKE